MLDTLNNVKSRLNITDSANDTFLTAQITLVSDTIEAYCRRKFAPASYAQTFYHSDYAACPMLELFHYPVTAVASVIENGITLSSLSYRIHGPTGRIIRTDGMAFFYRTPPLDLSTATVVTYTSGMTVPTPVLAVLDSIVQERYNKQTSGVNLNFGSDVQRISIPGAISIDFDYTLNNNDRNSVYGVILGNNLNILDDYRSERAVIGNSKLVYIA